MRIAGQRPKRAVRRRRATPLERLLAPRVDEPVATTLSVAAERAAEEFARAALQDDVFRRFVRQVVRRRAQALLERLLSDGNSRPRVAPRRPARRGWAK